jgi:hypothetical protein
MNRSFSKIRHIQEANVLLENRMLVEEKEESQMAVQKVMDLSTELGEPIDPEFAKSVCDCSIDDAKPEPNSKPEVIELIDEIKAKVKELVLTGKRKELVAGFRDLSRKIKRSQKLKNEPINEQGGLTAAFVMFGVSAPLFVWVIAGGIILYIIIKGIVALSSWIPKSSGHGCGRVVTYRVR